MALILGLAGGAIGALGAIQQGNANAAAADYNKEVAKRNKEAVADQLYVDIADKRLENRRQMASLRAAYGSSGLQLDGSPMEVLEDTATENAYDIAKMRYGARMKIKGYSEQATLFGMEKKAAKTAGYIGAASAMIGGVSSGIQNTDWS